MLLRTIIFFAAILASQGSLSQAAFTRPADAIKYRQAAFQVMSFHSQRIGGMAKGERPFDKVVCSQDAAIIELLATQMEAAFPAGTEMAPSKAKPEVWQDAAQFRQKMEDLKSSARKLSEATRSGDQNNIRAAFNQTAQSCKSCHEGFRNR
jgi:cytochrome c556